MALGVTASRIWENLLTGSAIATIRSTGRPWVIAEPTVSARARALSFVGKHRDRCYGAEYYQRYYFFCPHIMSLFAFCFFSQ